MAGNNYRQSLVRGKVVAYDEPSKGVFVNQKWYYPSGNSADYVDETMQGRYVELSLKSQQTDEENFNFIKKLSEDAPSQEKVSKPESQSSGSGSKQDYWRHKDERDIAKDERISRHGALNTAVAILGNSPKTDPKSLTKYLLKACAVSDQILRYANKDSDLKASLKETLKHYDEPKKPDGTRDGYDDSVVPIEDIEEVDGYL